LIKPPFNHHSTTAAPRHPHRNNHAILLPHQHRNNDAILLPRQHRNNAPIKLHALNIKLHTSLQTPSSTSNPSHHIKLHAPTTYTIHQARYNATSNNYPLNEHRVATFPAGRMRAARFPARSSRENSIMVRNGAVYRQKRKKKEEERPSPLF